MNDFMKTFIKNLEIAGAEIVKEIPKNIYIAKGEFGVAENGAIWVKDYKKELFLSKEVCIIIPNKIYETMQDAIKYINSPGVFIAGASKTADIESFLVFGAHGPKKLYVKIKKEKG